MTENISDICAGLKLMLLGPPGCGKGTQATGLSQRYNLLHFSTGNALREQIRLGTPLGKEVEPYLSKGILIPDEMIIEVTRATIEALPDGKGVLLDGFPRTIPQATALEAFLALDGVLLLELDDELVVERITGRRMGEDGQSYHVKYAPPPPGVSVTQRPDDTEAVVRDRLRVYHTQTKPLVDYYRERNLLHAIPGHGSIEEIGNLLDGAVSKIKTNLQ